MQCFSNLPEFIIFCPASFKPKGMSPNASSTHRTIAKQSPNELCNNHPINTATRNDNNHPINTATRNDNCKADVCSECVLCSDYISSPTTSRSDPAPPET